jgi:malate synthase
MNSITTQQIHVIGTPVEGSEVILTTDALEFVAKLHRATAERRQELLQARRTRRAEIAAGQDPSFLRETEDIRSDPSWRVAPPAPGLEDRRVEITGPVDKKMTINALNSGAKVWLADMEDSSTPSWRNVIQGQLNLTDALERRIDFTSTTDGRSKDYKLRPAEELPTIVVRPRGWHLPEKHMLIDGTPVAGGIVDFGLYFFHNARRLLAQGKGPYFYLPKIENHLEARLWNDIFILAQDLLGIPQGTIRAAGHCLHYGHHHRAGHPEQHRSGHPLHRVLAARQRRRGHPQPDGGRRHRGDLPLAAVAVDLLPRQHGPGRNHHPRVGGGHA